MVGKIVVIGANDFQNPLILKAKALGYETHVFAWRDGAVGEQTADVFYPISIVEIDRILEKCRQIRPDAVCSIGSDLAEITVNRVSNALGLPANPPPTAFLATNKNAMRQAFVKAGLPVPAFIAVRQGDDLSAVRRMRLPVIVKPTDRSGSRCITRLSTFEGLEDAVAQAIEVSFEGSAIIEEFIDGPEYSCECISSGGVHHLLAVTKKYTTGAPHFIETGHIEPSGLGPETMVQVQKTIFQALDALRITCGASHSEFKIVPQTGRIMMVEVGARMGGDFIGSHLVDLSTGVDFVKAVLDVALGRGPDLQPAHAPAAAAVRFVFSQRDLDALEHLKREHPELLVDAAMWSSMDRAITDSASRYGYFMMRADTAAALTPYLPEE